MPNTFTNLVPPAGNGVGVAADVSIMGPIKTITVQGVFTGVVIVEFSEDGGATFAQLASFAAGGKQTLTFAAQFMRVRRAGVGLIPGTPNIDVGSDDSGQLFLNLPVPAGNGVGASVGTALLGTLNTVVVGGTFTGNVIIEISEDNISWTQCLFFTRGLGQTKNFVARFMRVRRSGVGAVPGTPVVDVGAVNDPSAPAAGNTLNQAYNSGGPGVGRTIVADAGAVLIQSTAADDNNILELIKNPAGAQSGNAVDLTMGATTTGNAVSIDHDGSGNAVQIQHGGAGDAIGINLDGAAVGAQAIVVSETAVARTAVMMSLTRDALATATAHALEITNPGAGFAIRVVSGAISVDDVTVSTSPTTGSIQTDGGLGVVLDAFIGTNLDVAGLVALGNNASVSGFSAVTAQHDFGDQSATVSGMQVNPSRHRLAAPIATRLTGLSAGPDVGAANTQNWTATVGLRAFGAAIFTVAGGAGVITGAAGYHVEDATVAGATITRLQGMRIEAQTAGVTDNIGIWIEEPTGGATLNDAIHVVGGRTFLGGTIQQGTETPLATGVAITTANLSTDPGGNVVGNFWQHSVAAVAAPDGNLHQVMTAASIIPAANTQNFTQSPIGMAGYVSQLVTLPGGAGVLTGYAGYNVLNASISGVTLTDQFGILIDALTTGTNNTGLFINTPTGVIADAIHVVGGRSFFGGAVTTSATLNVNSVLNTGMGFGDPIGLGDGVFLQQAGTAFFQYTVGAGGGIFAAAGEQIILLDTSASFGLIISPDSTTGPVLAVSQAGVAGAHDTALTVTGGDHTVVTNVETVDVDFALDRTVQFTGVVLLPLQRAYVVRPPTYTSDTATKTITTAVTMDITGAPVAGLNLDITTPLALRVAGPSKFGNTAPSAVFTTAMELDHTFTDPTGAVGDAGLFVGIVFDETAAPSGAIHAGAFLSLSVGAANTQNWTALGNAAAYISLANGPAGTISNLSGVFVDSVVAGAGTITSLYGIRVRGMTQGTTDNFGIFIDTPSGGATRNDAIHVVGGRTLLGGALAHTGTDIGLYSAAIVPQHTSTGQTAGFVAGAGSAVLDDSTFTGGTGTAAYTIGDVVRAIKLIGIMAAS